MNLPILYSFRRCPYAMRARFALKYAGISCEIREVDLKAKPPELIEISPKGTVPVLVFKNGNVLQESMHIIAWAFEQMGGENLSVVQKKEAEILIANNDTAFVKLIHYYKYPERYPEQDTKHTQKKLFEHLGMLDQRLSVHAFLLGQTMTSVDIAIFPFVRQLVQIKPAAFHLPSLQHLLKWLDYFLNHPLFKSIMTNYPPWSPRDKKIVL